MAGRTKIEIDVFGIAVLIAVLTWSATSIIEACRSKAHVDGDGCSVHTWASASVSITDGGPPPASSVR